MENLSRRENLIFLIEHIDVSCIPPVWEQAPVSQHRHAKVTATPERP
jgi:hypothetical protein